MSLSEDSLLKIQLKAYNFIENTPNILHWYLFYVKGHSLTEEALTNEEEELFWEEVKRLIIIQANQGNPNAI